MFASIGAALFDIHLFEYWWPSYEHKRSVCVFSIHLYNYQCIICSVVVVVIQEYMDISWCSDEHVVVMVVVVSMRAARLPECWWVWRRRSGGPGGRSLCTS